MKVICLSKILKMIVMMGSCSIWEKCRKTYTMGLKIFFSLYKYNVMMRSFHGSRWIFKISI